MVGRDRRGAKRSGDRLRIAVLMGGPSSEHDVSLTGGTNVAATLTGERFDVRPVVIQREGSWRVAPPKRKAARFHAVAASGASTDAAPSMPAADFDPRDTDGWPSFETAAEALTELRAWGVDLVFPVLHGEFGEDGIVQACLRAASIPFVGSGHRGSALAFDKVRTKEIAALHGIPTPPWTVVTAADLGRGRAEHIDQWIADLGLPLVLKNPLGGSSLEVRIARDAGEAVAALDELIPAGEAQPTDRILVEKFIHGRELTAGVLEGREARAPEPLPIVEICTSGSEFFDYHEKYAADGADELCPAPIEAEVAAAAQAIGMQIHRLLGLSGMSRTDLRMSPDGGLHFLEVNTIPGMTDRGLLPLAARTAGVSFTQLIEGLVRLASTPA